MTNENMITKDVKREFVHSTYCRAFGSDTDDMLVIKEKLHYPDGRIEPNLRFLNNYIRKFWVTKEEYRDHTDKKEFEYLNKCEEYSCTQAELVKKVSKVMKMFGARRLSDVNESPYVYGTDITTNVLVAEEYSRLWPELVSDASLAMMDYETDVVNGTEEIISGSITMKDKVCLAVTEDFLGIHSKTAKAEVAAAMDKYLSEYKQLRNISDIDLVICNRPADVVVALFKRAHAWKPDFLGFWNITFDIGKILSALKNANINPAHVFSDPSVPRLYQSFNWRKADPIKFTADGKRTSKHIADLWHVVTAPSSFYCIDLMCLFKLLRVREAQRPSYSLDAILHDELDLGKLTFTETDGLTGLDWHYKMQTKYKIEYLIYNVFDCISVELLDEKTGDVAKGVRAAADISELSRLKSNPKRLSDATYFILLNEGKAIASVSSDMTEDLDNSTPNKKRWIITLPAELQYDTGMRVIKEYPTLDTNIITNAWDIDIASGYPTFGAICNVSKGTSRIEVCSIVGLNDDEGRAIGINLTGLKTNALEIANRVYGYPSLNSLLNAFQQTI